MLESILQLPSSKRFYELRKMVECRANVFTAKSGNIESTWVEVVGLMKVEFKKLRFDNVILLLRLIADSEIQYDSISIKNRNTLSKVLLDILEMFCQQSCGDKVKATTNIAILEEYLKYLYQIIELYLLKKTEHAQDFLKQFTSVIQIHFTANEIVATHGALGLVSLIESNKDALVHILKQEEDTLNSLINIFGNVSRASNFQLQALILEAGYRLSRLSASKNLQTNILSAFPGKISNLVAKTPPREFKNEARKSLNQLNERAGVIDSFELVATKCFNSKINVDLGKTRWLDIGAEIVGADTEQGLLLVPFRLIEETELQASTNELRIKLLSRTSLTDLMSNVDVAHRHSYGFTMKFKVDHSSFQRLEKVFSRKLLREPKTIKSEYYAIATSKTEVERNLSSTEVVKSLHLSGDKPRIPPSIKMDNLSNNSDQKQCGLEATTILASKLGNQHMPKKKRMKKKRSLRIRRQDMPNANDFQRRKKQKNEKSFDFEAKEINMKEAKNFDHEEAARDSSVDVFDRKEIIETNNKELSPPRTPSKASMQTYESSTESDIQFLSPVEPSSIPPYKKNKEMQINSKLLEKSQIAHENATDIPTTLISPSKELQDQPSHGIASEGKNQYHLFIKLQQVVNEIIESNSSRLRHKEESAKQFFSKIIEKNLRKCDQIISFFRVESEVSRFSDYAEKMLLTFDNFSRTKKELDDTQKWVNNMITKQEETRKKAIQDMTNFRVSWKDGLKHRSKNLERIKSKRLEQYNSRIKQIDEQFKTDEFHAMRKMLNLL